MKNKVKEKLIKYRSVVVIGIALIFNLIANLLVWHPEGVQINKTPMTITEWICDIVTIILFFAGFAMLLFDGAKMDKKMIKEGFIEGAEEFNRITRTVEMKVAMDEKENKYGK